VGFPPARLRREPLKAAMRGRDAHATVFEI
jgi:hypothetical protein